MEFFRQLRVRAKFALTTAALVITAAFGVSTLLLPTIADATNQTIPYLINFQGRLTDNNGNVMADGDYNIKFRLFTVATGGSNVWEADRVYGSSDDRISVQDGLFDIQLGDTTQGDPALTTSLFNEFSEGQLYLEVELPTPATATCASNGCATWTEGAMTPRQPLSSSPYAFNSQNLDGMDAGAFGQLTANNTFTGANLFAPTTSSTVALTVAASTTDDSDSLVVEDDTGATQAFFDPTGALTLDQALTAPTTTNTINNLVINNGALSNISGYAQASGNFLQSGTGTFGTGTGAVSLNGTTTIAANDNLIMPSGTGVFQQTFASPTAAATGQNLTFDNTNTTAAGVVVQGITISSAVSAPTSGTNSVYDIYFPTGSALTAAENVMGLDFNSAVGYTDFIKTPTFVLSSAGALTGVTGLTVTNVNNAVNANAVSSNTAFTATGITTGTGVSITTTTTGTGISITDTNVGDSSSKAISIGGAASGTLVTNSSNLINVAPTRTHTAATAITDSGNFLNLTRSETVNNAGGTINLTGALANLQSQCTQTAGTCNDSANILNLNQQYANASGAVLNVQGAGTGNQAVFNATNASANGVDIDVQSSSSSQYSLDVTSNNASTNLIYARADGHVGIGTTTPAATLDVNGTANATAFSVGGTAGASDTCTSGDVLQNSVISNGIVTGGSCAVPGSGASTSLNNLTTTSINQSLIPNANNTLDLGSVSDNWNNLYATNIYGGTVQTGLWQGTQVGVGYGGTGVTSFTAGALLYGATSSSLGQLADVPGGSCLTSNGSGNSPAWGSCSGSGGGANLALSNLSAVAINANMAPNADNTLYLGSASATWKGLYTASVDAGTTTTTLAVGTSNASAITLGQFGVTTSTAGTISVNSGTNVPTADQVAISNASSSGDTTANAAGLSINYQGGAAAVSSQGLRINFAPGTTSGGTWSGMQIDANATGPVSGVTEYGLELVGPSAAGAGQQTGIEVATGWNIGADIQSGGLQLAAQSDPSSPAAGNLRIYAKSVAGLVMPEWLAPGELNTAFQPGLGFNRIAYAEPNGTANCSTGTTGFGSTSTGAGTCTAPVPASTNLMTSVRMEDYSTGTTAGTVSYQRQDVLQVWRGSSAGEGGFFYETRFGLGTTQTGNYVFAGLADSVANPTSVDPTTNSAHGKLGLAIDVNTGDWNWINNVTGTAPTVTNLGSSFPVNTTDLYELMVYCPPDGSTITYRVTDVSTGAQVTNSVTTNIPAATTFLAPEFYISNNAQAAAAILDFNGWYLQSDN